MTHPSGNEPGNIPIGSIRWKLLGHLSMDQDGNLVFPPAAAEPGIYQFVIYDGAEVTAGYIGQAAKSLATRFGLYRTRGRKP